MTANRLVLAAMIVGVAAGVAVAQQGAGPSTSPGKRIVPAQGTAPMPPGGPMSNGMPPMTTGMPMSPGMPPMTTTSPPVTIPPMSGTPTGSPTPMSTLTGAPDQYPPGTVHAPWCGNERVGTPLPIGANGPITYEVYLQTGPSILVGNPTLTDAAKSGWMVGGGHRTLFFNTSQTAAWVANIGLSYTRNDGQRFDNPPVLVTASELKGGSVGDNSLIALGIRGISRTSLNYSLGRDWWLSGPGTVTGEDCVNNWRFGGDIGGRYGTASIDFAPTGDPNGYRRRHSILHGVFAGGHLHWERSFGNFTAFAGLRTEWAYTWTNLIPPNDSDFIDVNILVNFGIRF